MDTLLFAANDPSQFVFLAIVALVSIISAAIKNRNQNAQVDKERERNRQRNRPAAEETKEPAKELERFLNELSDKKKPQQQPKPQPSRRPQGEQRPGRKPKPAPTQPPRLTPANEGPRSPQVLHRHLTSSLDQRHQESMHSSLESKRLRSEVSDRHLAAMDPAAKAGTRGTPLNPLDNQILDLIPRDQNDFTRAFVFSQIFGPPIGLR